MLSGKFQDRALLLMLNMLELKKAAPNLIRSDYGLGLGIRQKFKYAVAYIEAILFRVNSKLNKRGPVFSQIRYDGNWFINLQESVHFLPEFVGEITHEAKRVINHRFSLLGTGEQYWGNNIQWNLEINSSRPWPLHYYKRISSRKPSAFNGCDIKIPWELSRFQQLMPLIKSYLLTKEYAYSKESVNQINDWINKNPPYYGVNWTCAMEVAIRVCNWMWAWWALKDTPSWTKEFTDRFLKNIWHHGWFIEHNIEDKGGIKSNHYLSDIVGLLFIGIMFPQFMDSERWKKFGIQELIRCMEEMVYPDGVSFENSTAYHRLFLELFTYSAILCKRNDIVLPAPFWQRLEKMFEFIMHGMRSDGRMPMIGDADDGRFFILADYYDWDRWDFRYLLSIGAVLFKRSDFKLMADRMHEEVCWLFGEDGVKRYGQL